MNRIQKAATAFVALATTLVGSTLVTAPLTLADIGPASHQGISTVVVQSRTSPMGAPQQQT